MIPQNDQCVDDCIREHEQLASARGIWEGHWREVAERVRPIQNFFQQTQRGDGDKRNQRVFDDTAALALDKFVAAVISMSFPATQRYHSLMAHDPALAKIPAVRAYCEQVTDLLFRYRYAPHANFMSQSGDVVADVGAFGTGIMFIDDAYAFGVRYKAMPLAQSYIAQDGHGTVDALHRKWQMTVHQAATLWGFANLPESMKTAYAKDKNAKFWILHAVRPNMDIDIERADAKGMKWTSHYISLEDRFLLSEGGFRTFPFACPRFETSPNECYGRGPAMKVLQTIKTLNEMKKTVLRAGQKVVDPPVMLADDGALQPFSVRPNATNYGYIDNNGNALAKPFETAGKIDLGLELMDKEREVINDAFFVTLFRILVEEPTITATEAMLRAQEKGQLLAPTMGRVQSEFLGTTIEREMSIHAHAGRLPPMPPELMEARGAVKIEYQSPLNQAQRASTGVAIMNTINAVAPLAQVDKRVTLLIDAVKTARELADINGFPADCMNSDEDIAAMSEKQQQADSAAQLLAAAPVAAGAAKDFAGAASLAASMPNQAAPNLGLPGA